MLQCNAFVVLLEPCMKKKPPPGATLIARLKEKRLQRESTDDAAAAESGHVLDVEAQEVEGGEHDGSEQGQENSSVEIALRDPQAATPDLFQSNVSIDELRPSTDDYSALTDEIRIAGRFAAIGLVAQGLRLARIQHAEIYLQHYPSFEEYCRNEHDMSATYAYRLIRMARLAERFAERPSLESDKSDPYEVMLNLGHRHLMALLPLKDELVEEFLVQGVPLIESESAEERVPLDRATEKQIKQALKKDGGDAVSNASMVKRAEKMLGKELPKLVGMIEECANWLETSPAEIEMAKMEKAGELKKLGERFKLASEKIFEALSSES